MTRYSYIFLFIANTLFLYGQDIDDYSGVIRDKGLPPIEFVEKKLDEYDLIIFDDALHSALEPFEFYIQLLKHPGNRIDYVFIEVFGINDQPFINAYLDSESKDRSLLNKVFQDDYSGMGWRYETYLDLLSAIWDINHNNHNDSKKIKVVAVDQPIYWEGLHTREDYNIFQRSLVGRDHFMYRIIVEQMSDFKEKKKGIFLTNTRHAYKNIRNSEGRLYWNCGTFFYHWNPKKTYSIRIHNVTLSLSASKEKTENASTEGLDAIEYHWIEMDNGAWDRAFAANKNLPVAIPLENNAFGRTKYAGNHMLNVLDNQTMFDAYDALIFLAPLEDLHFSPKIDFIYTESFKTELIRRLKILHGKDLQQFLEENGADSAEGYLHKNLQYRPKSKNTLLRADI